MAEHQHRTRRFLLSGVCLACAVDSMPEGKYPILRNIRSYQLGVIQPRPGLLAYIASAIPDLITHSCIRLNDDITSASQSFAIFLGAGNSIYSDNSTHTIFTNRQSGFSGNPLSLIPFRPSNSPEPFLYVGDSLKSGKFKIDGIFRNQGIFPPLTPPTGPGTTIPSLSLFQSTTVESGISTAGLWVADGTVLGTITNGLVASHTISAIIYDSGLTGWASVATNFSGTQYQVGRMLTTDIALPNTETVIIDSIYKAVKTTVIQSITYDSGTTGLCTITLVALKRKALVPNALVLIAGEAAPIRVLSVSEGADDIPSFRCSTTVTHTPGQSVTGLVSWRAFFQNTHSVGEAYDFRHLNFNVVPFTGIPANSTVTGFATRTVSLDLSSIGNRPIQDEDEMNLILRLSGDDEVIKEVQLQFDINNSNYLDYYYLAFRPSDLAMTTGTSPDMTLLTAKQSKIQRDQIDAVELPPDETQSQTRERLQRRLNKALKRGNTARIERLRQRLASIPSGGGEGDGPSGGGGSGTGGGTGDDTGSPSSTPIAVGRDVFVPIRLKIKNIPRVGTDFTKGWADVTSIRLRATFQSTTTDPRPIISLTSWWIGGSFGPDAGEANPPYIYRYVYRASESGAKSYPSPATRSGVIPRRQRVQLVAAPSSDVQVDKIDWYRFGGTIQRWKYIGTGNNNSSTFNDDFPDDSIQNNSELNFSTFKPFPVAGLPITATCSVSGTMVTVLTGSVSLSMAPGTPIVINSTPCTLYAPPISTTKFEIVESIGIQTSVSLFIPEPILMGTPLPCMWGPFGEGELGTVLFAVGDTNNPGTVYYTNPDDPDSASDLNFLEVCSPSEPLMNGFIFDSNSFVFSSEELYILYPTTDISGRLRFNSRARGLGLGLAGRYAFCVGEGKIIFVGKDGIYVTEGSTPISLTDEDLYPLFPHDGQPGIITNGFIPPDYSQPNFLRLALGDSEIRFDYKGTDGNFYTLVYNFNSPGWLPDTYGRQITHSYFEEGRSTHRWLLGSTVGKLFSLSGTSDDGLPISFQVRTKSDDADDPRPKKIFADVVLDTDPNNILNLTVQPGFDNYTSLPAPTLVTGASRLEPPKLIDINVGLGLYARNLALDITGSSTTATPKLYFWSFSYLPKEEDIARRATDADNLGTDQAKWVQGFRIRVNTYNQPKTFKVQSDTGLNGIFTDVAGGSFTVNSNGESVMAFSFDEPFITHLVRIVGTDDIPWALESYEFIWEPEPELVFKYKTQPTTLSLKGYFHLRDMYIAHISSTDIELIVTIDGTPLSPIIIPHGSGVFTKSYVQLPANKGKVYQFSTETSEVGHRLYRKACECRGKVWSSNEHNAIFNVFGDEHNVIGARI